ncbi:MAG TPA: glutamate--tRNA ligase family protein, partial [Marinobacter sp.]
EGFYAYQLAVVADDIDQGITHVVRGSDLLDMTAQQQQIYQALGANPPHWMHIPVILNAKGQKLSKQNHAPALDDRQAKPNLERALAALGQNSTLLSGAPDIATLLDWAATNWAPERIDLTAR